MENKKWIIKEKYSHKCVYCGYEWFSRVLEPKACPRCKVYIRWDKIKKISKK